MDFIIKYCLKSQSEIKIKYCDQLILTTLEINTLYIEKLKHLDYIELSDSMSTQYAIGDVIRNDKSVKDLSKSKGLFYLLTLSEQNQYLKIMPDEHGLLPIYYFEQGDYIYISSSYMALVPKLATKTQNPDFYVELGLLYTQLNGATFFKEIKRLGYGEIIEMNGNYNITSVNRFFNYFTKSPKSFKSSISDIANKFIEVSKSYFNQFCAISLTGGFDGRTITGCAHYYNYDFLNFSYGKKGSGDVDNPIWLTKKLKLNYYLVELGKDYLAMDYMQCVESYIKFSGGLNGFQYPQSLYNIKKVKREIIVTGYLGSDVLANVRESDDEVHPQTVIDYLLDVLESENYAYSLLPNLLQLKLIQDKDCITRVLTKLDQFFSKLPSDLTKNQKYAVFSFENIYRNTFGVWIYNGMHYAKIRVPFIDKEFFDAITKTKISQFYRAFLEKNLRKRIVGQLLYPNILKKVYPEINVLSSSKGYSPYEVLTFFGRLRIAYRKKKGINAFSEKNGLDKLSTISGAILYMNKFVQDPYFSDFDINRITNEMNIGPINRSLCFLALSKFEFQRIINLNGRKQSNK